MSSDSATTRHAFVVRIWHEPDQSGWHGSVHYVGTGESAGVRDMEELVAFIEKQVDRPAHATGTGLR